MRWGCRVEYGIDSHDCKESMKREKAFLRARKKQWLPKARGRSPDPDFIFKILDTLPLTKKEEKEMMDIVNARLEVLEGAGKGGGGDDDNDEGNKEEGAGGEASGDVINGAANALTIAKMTSANAAAERDAEFLAEQDA